jgi:hypothetical protein
MTDQSFIVVTVECANCNTKQNLHVAARISAGAMVEQTITCIKSEKDFDVRTPNSILAGPFPVSQ